MIPRCNLHTHTSFCDGKNTAEEMVQGAIALGCETLGFSGHSTIEGAYWTMPAESNDEYICEIKRLKEKYRDQIEIALGIEFDVRSKCDNSLYEYIIGAAHAVRNKDFCFDVDLSSDALKENVDKYYGGDFYTFASEYYEGFYTLCDITKCDIVAHFDLVTKMNEGYVLFDESDRRYRDAALMALDYLLEKKELIFEMNTGAISRGYRKTPYPAEFILRRMAEKGARIMLNSDTHAANTIFTCFEEATDFAKYCGVKSFTIFKNGKFEEIGI